MALGFVGTLLGTFCSCYHLDVIIIIAIIVIGIAVIAVIIVIVVVHQNFRKSRR